jgi:predicted permease
VPIKIKFVIFQIIIILPFITGYISRRFIKNTQDTAKKIIRINLLSIEPLIVLWSIWGLTLSFDQVFLPLSGLALVIAGFLIGLFTVLFTGRKGPGRKTYLISSSLANSGFTMGGFICYLIAGEKGLGLSAIFTLYFMPYTFIFIFSYAKTNTVKKLLSLNGFIENFFNLQNMPLYAIMLALFLHVIGFKRPNVNIPLDALLLISIGLYYFTLGLNFSLGDFKSTGKEQFLLAVTKFLILPIITIFILGLTHLDPGVKTIIIVQSFMPAAVYSVVSSILFDLDSRLASSLFVINTVIFLILVLPILFLYREIIGF